MGVEFTRVTRDYVQVRDLRLTNPDGTTTVPDEVKLALVAPGGKLTASTTWHPTDVDEDGVPQFLVAGPDAVDKSNAYLLTSPRDVHVQATTTAGLVLTKYLGRITLR